MLRFTKTGTERVVIDDGRVVEQPRNSVFGQAKWFNAMTQCVIDNCTGNGEANSTAKEADEISNARDHGHFLARYRSLGSEKAAEHRTKMGISDERVNEHEASTNVCMTRPMTAPDMKRTPMMYASEL